MLETSAYDISQWHDLFIAEAGAAAALAGLLFVAVSINLKQILALPSLPARAAAVLATLIVALVVSTLAPVPPLRCEVFVLELLVSCGSTWLSWSDRDSGSAARNIKRH